MTAPATGCAGHRMDKCNQLGSPSSAPTIAESSLGMNIALSGKAGREYNLRKNRKGAFWEDRYHATAVKTGNHLIRCLAYIDLNRVSAGVVRHPVAWIHSGYHEIQKACDYCEP